MADDPRTVPRALVAHAREGKTIPKTLRARVNRLAHRRAEDYAQRLRDGVFAELQEMLDSGAGFDALAAVVADHEGA